MVAKAPKYDRAEAEAHMKAFGEAFASDNFDSKKMTTGAAVNGHMAAWGVTRMVHFYEAVTPALTLEQVLAADAAARRVAVERVVARTGMARQALEEMVAC